MNRQFKGVKDHERVLITGEEFNKVFPEVIKFTNAYANHRGVVFEVGKVVHDPVPWSDGECQPGGIYFTTRDNMEEWYDHYNIEIGKMCRVFAVRVHPQAKVAVFTTKAKATSIEILRELDYDLLVADLVREKEIKREQDEKMWKEEQQRRREEEQRRREEEQRRREEEQRRREEKERKRLAFVAELRQLGVKFHKFLKADTIERLTDELASELPLVIELAKERNHDINNAKFDKVYKAISVAILGEYNHLCFAPFLSPRLLHVANLELRRYDRSYYFEKEEIELMDLHPEFFSKQPYSKYLAKHLTYLLSYEFPNIQKALGMI